MNFKAYLSCLLILVSGYLQAQVIPQLNAAEIKQGLESLQVTGSVLYMAAHPDDENTRLLAYLAKEMKVRTGYLSLTRGDGGQNLIGTEQADLLGVIRTQELLAARRMDGAEQFFTRANDFGFSKNPEESFKVWGKQKILGDAVWVIRNFKPDVIIARFPEDSRAGHGHHSASAILAREAFTAAADPKQFPEQLKYTTVWQAKRVVWNTFNFGGANTTSPDQLTLDVGGYNALLGKSYGEIAAESRSNHKSQGFGSAKQRGSALEYFSPIAGVPAKRDLFEGIDFSLNRYPQLAKAQQILKAINQNYQVANPSQSIAALLQLRTAVKGLPFKHQQLDELILACAGLFIETTVPRQAYALHDMIPVQVQAISRTPAGFPLKISIQTAKDAAPKLLVSNQQTVFTEQLSTDKIGLTQPYWLEKKHAIGSYEVDSLSKLGRPENPAPSIGSLLVTIGDQQISVQRPLVYKSTDPVRGELYQPLTIAPPITATLAEKAYVFNGNTERQLTVTVRSFKDNSTGTVSAEAPAGWTVSPQSIPVKFNKTGEEQTLTFHVKPGGQNASGTFALSVQTEGSTYHQGFLPLSYDHIPVQTLFPFADAKVERLDLKIAGKRIGYIAGAGDLTVPALRQIGYEVTVLTESQVLTADLSGFDAIVAGVRLYNINDHIAAMQTRLMEYVKNGGTYVVQYNVNAPLKIAELGPYPFKLSRDRVTEEDAVVTFLAPESPLLNFPNRITQKDFEGWVQERGIYFTTAMDAKYTPILSMHDTGEQANNGSLIVADYGKGKYIYTGLVFYRELPAGVPGAYRLFVNLLSAGAAK
ncbi:PIG-L family deacetylase [Pedobacter duraquae]|uniref:GlcNAc-PI de-N-acetylase n=1 Tax=Pedobacter duraquae TaxID=425511 RepID=A0A4R6ISG1_9SPHI|nr:PIG-L family deacetylase [Pedobacter duraquae]TDO24825.1 GlcNAc-PI de-N-acetylase [Pedobacter duraquae]